MAPEPRALFIAPTAPAASGNGLAMRQGVFHDALRRVAHVETLVLPLWGGAPDDAAIARFGAMRSVPLGAGDTQFQLIHHIPDPATRLERFRHYGRGSRHALLSAPVLGDISRMFADDRFDLVHVARLYLSETRAMVDTATATLDLDEDDAWAWRLRAETQAGDDAGWSNAEADAEDRLLARLGPRFDALFAAGPQDLATLGARHPLLPVEAIPNAVPFPPAPARRDDGRTLVFIGALGYPPNRDGVLWFIRHVWPLLRAQDPRPLRFRIVGAGNEMAELAGIPGVEVLGHVGDLGPIYAEATLALAPLHTGAGTRIKVIEAVAHRVPVVATSIAVRGLDFAQPDSLWLADAPEAFAAAILAALENPDERRHRADAAYAAAHATHDRDDVVNRLASRFAAVLAGAHLQRGAQ